MTFLKGNPQTEQSSFDTYLAVQKLKELASDPIDLTHPGVLNPERIQSYCAEGCGFKLLYATERVDDTIMEGLEELALETDAVKKMHNMQNGETINFIEGFPSENRPALHTATRDVFGQPNPHPKAKEASLLARQELDKLESFIAKIDLDQTFDTLIVIAIGGSYLGPLANYKALEYLKQPKREVYFISNLDPDNTAYVLSQITDLSRTLVLVVSKSGTTLETVTNEEFMREQFKLAGLKAKEHFLCVTCPGTPMDRADEYLKVFYMWDWIGGRFSTTSMAGTVLLAFAFGWEVLWSFLEGAHRMDQLALEPDLHHNLPLLAALLGVWNRNFLNYPTVALIPYSQALARFPAHIQQVSMESNGKLIDKLGHFVNYQTGPIIWGEPGTDAQHSFFQLLHQGTAPVPLSMIGFKHHQYQKDVEFGGTTSQEKLLANLFAQALALATGQKSDNPNKFFPGNRPSHILLGEKLTPFSLGALLSFYEHLVAFEGFIWNINSFDQEGVQLGKGLATKLIEQFARRKGKGTEKESYPLGEAFLQHLDAFQE